jgi:antitoxin component of MazEF toxin-antitoxin module
MTRRIQKIGNSRGLVLDRTMLEHLGVTTEVEVNMEQGRIILTAPQASSRQRQSFEDAKNSTFAQYDTAMQRLADA